MVDVYFPPGYDENPDWHFPVIYYLHGWGGNQNTMNTMTSLLTQMIEDNIIEPVIMVGADNSPPPLDGSGYVNSFLWGDYEDYNVYDLVQWIDASFRTKPERNARGLFGQSMGGYGAFRYGIFHHDIFGVLASHAGPLNFNDEFFRIESQATIKSENNPGPPYTYTFGGYRPSTILNFLGCGMYAPDTNTPQTYVNPPIVQFFMDENGDYIDTVLAKQKPYDIIFLIDSLSPSDSVGIFFGCGENDEFFLYPGHLALKDSMDLKNLSYEFFSHSGGHNPPDLFKEQALTFLDSLLTPPGPLTVIDQAKYDNECGILTCYPNPCNSFLNVSFRLKNQSSVKIDIFNALACKVDQIFYGEKEVGIHQINYNSHSLSRGIYYITITTIYGKITQKIIKN
jgi:S-formylglutathione hydrolase FrmB